MNFVYINAGDLINERKFMVSLGRLVFRATGVMSNRGVMKNSRKIGTAIAEKMKQTGGKIESQEIEQIISDTIGKKAAKKIKIVDSKTAMREEMVNAGEKIKDIDKMFECAAGATHPDHYSRKASVFVNEEFLTATFPGMTSALKANTLGHEIQHAISNTSGRMGLYKLKGHFSFGRKMIDKKMNKAKALDLQTKYVELQDICLKSLLSGKQVSEADIVKTLYSKGILQVGKDKENAFILKNLRDVYKDECRSYKVGYEAFETFNGTKNPKQVNEILNLYENFVKATNKELRHARLNRVKRFFGFKPNTAREQAIIKQQQVTEVEKLDFAKVAKADSNSKVKAKLFENNK